MKLSRLSPEVIIRIRQLRRAGYPTSTIGRLFGIDRSLVTYHTKGLPRMELADFLRAILPHSPVEGPPFPRGVTFTWEELERGG